MERAETPDGWHTVTPRVFAEDPAGLVEFLRSVFDARGDLQANRPSEIWIGDSVLMVTGAEVRGAIPACLYVYVHDADAIYARALASGAASVEAPMETPYGDRRAVVRDAFGNTWQIATRRARLDD